MVTVASQSVSGRAGKRRFSDQAFGESVRADEDEMVGTKRRQTIGGDIHRQHADTSTSSATDTSASTSTYTSITTPLKQKVSLGSAAASAYYFSGLPKTPLSTSKYKHNKHLKHLKHSNSEMKNNLKANSNSVQHDDVEHMHTETRRVMKKTKTSPTCIGTGASTPIYTVAHTGMHTFSDKGIQNPEEAGLDGTTMNISTNDISASTESSDLMNRSVLSDTTELTASNFVLAATSRQKFMHLAKLHSEKENRIPYDQQNSPTGTSTASIVGPKQNVATAISELAEPETYLSTVSAFTSFAGNGSQGTSPTSLRKLTVSLMQSRLQNDEHSTNRLPLESKEETASLKQVLSPEIEAIEDLSAIPEKISEENLSFEETGSQLDVSKASLDDLFDGLLDDKKSISPDSASLLVSPHASASNEHTNGALTFQFYTDDKSVTSLSSPGVSPISTEATKEPLFRLKPSKKESKLTPTKLMSSPRRVLNLNTKDSPARNTRSAAKSLPFTEAVDKESTNSEPVGFKRSLFAVQRSKSSRRASGLEMHHMLELDNGGASSQVLAPKSILNSAKKRSRISEVLARKTVAFGSPEAAEYHIGSPSVSLTPMPSIQAKAMFSIPRASSRERDLSVSSSDSNSSGVDEEKTYAVDDKVDTNEMPPSEAAHDELDTREAATTYNDDARDITLSSEQTSCPDLSLQDKTVELESSLNGLIELIMPSTAASHGLDGSDTAPLSAPFEHRIGISKNSSPPSDAQQCLFHGEDTETIQLESTISGLLKAAHSNSAAEGLNEPHSSQHSARLTDVDSPKVQHFAKNLSSEQPCDFSDPKHCASTDPPAWTMVMDDEENTVELETDMSAIFAMAASGAECHESLPALKLADRYPNVGTLAPETNRMSFGQSINIDSRRREEGQTPRTLDFGLSDSPAPSSVKQRKSERSQRRFSLAKSSQLSVASEGSVFALSPSAGEAAFSQQKDEVYNEVEQEQEPFTINCQEIGRIVEFSDLSSNSTYVSGFHSAVHSLCETEEETYFQIRDSIYSFAAAVCGEVEEKVSLSSSVQACFEDLVQSIGDEKVDLQRWIRDTDGTHDLKSIAASVRTVVEQEWSDWERTVLDSLIVALQQVAVEIDPESRKLDHYMALVDDLNEALSITAGKVAERARRLRFSRHENTAKSLSTEIADLESQLTALDHRVDDVKEDLDSAGRIKDASDKRASLQGGIEAFMVVAESSHGRFVSVKALCGVSSISVDGSSISLSHTRCTPLSCLSSQFSFISGGSIRCKLVSHELGLSATGGIRERLSKSSAAYVKSRCAFMSNVLCNEELGNVEEMCSLIRELNWTLGRVESTARELTALQKRFNVTVERDLTCKGELAEFLVNVSFSGGKEGSILVTSFDLTSSYPFGPLNVSFEPGYGDLDLSYFQRQLMKSAKPGFGYLSRACDVISATMKSR